MAICSDGQTLFLFSFLPLNFKKYLLIRVVRDKDKKFEQFKIKIKNQKPANTSNSLLKNETCSFRSQHIKKHGGFRFRKIDYFVTPAHMKSDTTKKRSKN